MHTKTCLFFSLAFGNERFERAEQDTLQTSSPEVGIQFAGIFPHSACRPIPIFVDELCTRRFNTCVRANNVILFLF